MTSISAFQWNSNVPCGTVSFRGSPFKLIHVKSRFCAPKRGRVYACRPGEGSFRLRTRGRLDEIQSSGMLADTVVFIASEQTLSRAKKSWHSDSATAVNCTAFGRPSGRPHCDKTERDPVETDVAFEQDWRCEFRKLQLRELHTKAEDSLPSNTMCTTELLQPTFQW